MKYAKAAVAILGAALTAALATLPPDTKVYEILTVLAAVATGLGVWHAPYAPAEKKQKNQAGDVDVLAICILLTFVGVLLIFLKVYHVLN